MTQTWGQFNSGIDGQVKFRNCLFKKNVIGIDKFGTEIEACYQKKFYPQIHLQ